MSQHAGQTPRRPFPDQQAPLTVIVYSRWEGLAAPASEVLVRIHDPESSKERKGGLRTRRQFVERVASLAPVAFATPRRAVGQSDALAKPEPYKPSILPAGIRSRFIDNVNGLRVHLLEAGFDAGTRPCLLPLHGFPELAFSWRKIMEPLAAAGFHVLAPDLR